MIPRLDAILASIRVLYSNSLEFRCSVCCLKRTINEQHIRNTYAYRVLWMSIADCRTTNADSPPLMVTISASSLIGPQLIQLVAPERFHRSKSTVCRTSIRACAHLINGMIHRWDEQLGTQWHTLCSEHRVQDQPNASRASRSTLNRLNLFN